MKIARFILIACCFLTLVLSLFTLTRVLSERAGQDGEVQVLTKSDVFVADDPNGHNNGTSKTVNSHSIMPSSELVASANPTSQVDISLSEDLSVSNDKPNLLADQKNQPIVTVDSTDEMESRPVVIDDSYTNGPEVYGQYGEELPSPDEMKLRPVVIDDSYTDSPEVYGQYGEELPSPEILRAYKAQSILQYYSDRTAEAVIIVTEEGEADDYGAEPTMHSLSDDIGLDAADMKMFAEGFADVESVIEMLAEQNLCDEVIDPELQINRLLVALAEDNPSEIRLQAIYLLADAAYELVEEFLDDPEDLIRYEAERLVGIFPED